MRLWRLLILMTIALGFSQSLLAHPVTQATAKAIACKFMRNNDLQIVSTYQTDQEEDAFYVFNTPDGFVIVSADDCETPIIAYSHEGCFDPDDIPIPLEDYLQDFVARIQYGIENQVFADRKTVRQWELVKTTGRLHEGRTERSAGPLLTEKWHQGCLYNSLCPTMQGPCGHAEVGCVAVAMGQIMHYWRYPATGWGSHSYSNAGTTLSADFGNTSYEWDLMPDSLTDQSSQAEVDALSTMLFHCGVAVNMNYTSSGSTAILNDALIRYFNYSRHLRKESRSVHSDEEWIALLKQCLDQQRPIYCSGFGDAGHAFVCDGYDDNNLFHFNWGWGGSANGYFTFGNLNPNGHNFNNGNYAILDIVPQSEPCLVSATVFPSNMGTVEGTGEYHYGASCTLTVTPAEGYDFYCWKQDGVLLSESPSITLQVRDDILLEACLSCASIGQITANYSPEASDTSSYDMVLSWLPEDLEWNLLKQFEVSGNVGGVATDDEHIYLVNAPWDMPDIAFEKYTMDGELVEAFNLEGIPDPLCLAYDGTYFYCNPFGGMYSLTMLYRIDLNNKTVLDSIWMDNWFGTLAYDPEYDGFWLGHDHQAMLHNREGHKIRSSPTITDYLYGLGYYTSRDGRPHLFQLRQTGIYNYDIEENIVHDRPLFSSVLLGEVSYGACVGKYEGKDAIFFAVDNVFYIYEIKCPFALDAQIVCYRIYRSDSAGQTVMVADEVTGVGYHDTSWRTVPNGVYRYGITAVYADGSESDPVWSAPVIKTDYGIQESICSEKRIQKIVENGHLFILVNGKKYSVTGQEVR